MVVKTKCLTLLSKNMLKMNITKEELMPSDKLKIQFKL